MFSKKSQKKGVKVVKPINQSKQKDFQSIQNQPEEMNVPFSRRDRSEIQEKKE